MQNALEKETTRFQGTAFGDKITVSIMLHKELHEHMKRKQKNKKKRKIYNRFCEVSYVSSR